MFFIEISVEFILYFQRLKDYAKIAMPFKSWATSNFEMGLKQ